MVFSSTNPAPQSYHLWRRFRMPRFNKTSDAIAVEAKVAHELNSAYTFLLEHVVLLVWSLFIFSGVLLALKLYKKRHPEHPITKKLWAKKTSPFDILKWTTKSFVKQGEYRTFLIVLWAILSLGFIVAKYAVPIYFARFIIIDNAAPVNSQAMYYPTYLGVDASTAVNDPTTVLDILALEGPSALRAAGIVDSLINSSSGNPQVSLENLAPDPTSGGEPNQRINYSYTVTGLDFGLQRYPDLFLNVEGSCHTNYSWWVATTPISISSGPTLIEDTYVVFSNASSGTYTNVSLLDGPPSALFSIGQVSAPATNRTWSAIVSSVNRTSYFSGNDPWYLTVQEPNPPSPAPAKFNVKPGRPALSCWQNDVWSYHGHESSITELTPSRLPGLNLSIAMQDIFAHFLSVPKIPVLAQRLGISALKSASTYQGGIFNASSSSLYNDLERLVFASYIATVNTLTETTLFASGSTIPNDLYGISGSNSIPAGADEFVIWSNDVSTLSVKALIIIPVITVTLWIIAITVLLLRLPEIEELKVAVKATLADGKEQAVEVVKQDLGDYLSGGN